MLTVLVPAHNEGTKEQAGVQAKPAVSKPQSGVMTLAEVRTQAHGYSSQLEETLDSLRNQTMPPDRIVVIADNCTDDTVAIALEAGVDVFETRNNRHKKAGGLNQWLDENLSNLPDEDLVMVMDADSALNLDFLENALKYIALGFHAVGGVFLGKDGGGFVGMLQRNEYARYARDVRRRSGQTLVLTGTATVFTVKCLKDVVAGREAGAIPGSAGDGQRAQVYDTKALTEDNELTFALLHLGYKIIAPEECGLRTEVMETWGDLARQRFRWKRGAIENNSHYGITRYTAKYWFLQIWGILGVLVTATYLTSLALAIAFQTLVFAPLWILVTVVYMLERVVTVSSRGWKQMTVGGLILIEMPYDIWLQGVQAWALLAAVFKTRKAW